MELPSFRKMLHSKNVPFYALPRSDDPMDVIRNKRMSPVTVQRKIKVGAVRKRQVIRVSSATQRSIFVKLADLKPPYPPWIIGFSSVPTDVYALETAGYLHHALLRSNPNLTCYWCNVQSPFVDYDNKSDLIIFYNIAANSTKLQRIRDVIMMFNKPLKIVVVAGTDAVDFFDNKLHCPISGMVHITDDEQEYIKHRMVDKTTNIEEKKEIKRMDKVFSPELINSLCDLSQGTLNKIKKV